MTLKDQERGTRLRSGWAQRPDGKRTGTRSAPEVQQTLSKRLPEISRHIANEAMHRCFCNAVTDDRVHRFSHGAERRLVNSIKIQLRFRSGQWVDRKLALHE